MWFEAELKNIEKRLEKLLEQVEREEKLLKELTEYAFAKRPEAWALLVDAKHALWEVRKQLAVAYGLVHLVRKRGERDAQHT